MYVELHGWALTRWISAALVLMVAAILLTLGWSDSSLHAVVRWTARTSLCLFLLAFSASSLRRLWPVAASGWLLRNRRYLGVGFAVSHLLHLTALGLLAVFFPQPFRSEQSLTAILGGGLAYVFIAAMALTSSDRAQTWLGRRRWRQLHLFGSYVIWIVFAQSYLGRAVEDLSYLPFAVAVVGALVLRGAASLRGTTLAASRSGGQ